MLLHTQYASVVTVPKLRFIGKTKLKPQFYVSH